MGVTFSRNGTSRKKAGPESLYKRERSPGKTVLDAQQSYRLRASQGRGKERGKMVRVGEKLEDGTYNLCQKGIWAARGRQKAPNGRRGGLYKGSAEEKWEFSEVAVVLRLGEAKSLNSKTIKGKEEVLETSAMKSSSIEG